MLNIDEIKDKRIAVLLSGGVDSFGCGLGVCPAGPAS